MNVNESEGENQDFFPSFRCLPAFEQMAAAPREGVGGQVPRSAACCTHHDLILSRVHVYKDDPDPSFAFAQVPFHKHFQRIAFPPIGSGLVHGLSHTILEKMQELNFRRIVHQKSVRVADFRRHGAGQGFHRLLRVAGWHDC